MKKPSSTAIGAAREDERVHAYEAIGGLAWAVPRARMFFAPKHRTQDIFGYWDLIVIFPGKPWKPVLEQVCGIELKKSRLKKFSAWVNKTGISEWFTCRLALKKKNGSWEVVELNRQN